MGKGSSSQATTHLQRHCPSHAKSYFTTISRPVTCLLLATFSSADTALKSTPHAPTYLQTPICRRLGDLIMTRSTTFSPPNPMVDTLTALTSQTLPPKKPGRFS